MCAVVLVLVARNPFPWIEIPPAIDMGTCLVGHELSFLLPVHTKGAGGTFSLSSATFKFEEDTCDPQNSHNTLEVNQFIVYPKHFKLRKDESGDIVILFMPHSPGEFMFNLTVASECGLEWSTQISGLGINLYISAEDEQGKKIVIDEPEREVFFGSATVFSTHVCKNLVIENCMPVSVGYHWTIEDKNSTLELEREDCCKKDIAAFFADPCFGILNPESRTSFTFTFTPNEPRCYLQQACLYVDTRHSHSLQSTRWKELQEIMPNLKMQAYNVQGGSEVLGVNVSHIVKVMSLMFSGDGEPLQMELIPPVLHILDIVKQGQSYTTSVLLKNNSCVDLSFSWQLPDVPCVTAPNLNHITISPSTGTVTAMSTREFQVHLNARAIGALYEKIICQIIGGPQTALYVEGSIQGPSIQIAPAVLDFGIVQVGNNSSLELTLTNISTCPASFKLLAAYKLPGTSSKPIESLVTDAPHFNCWKEVSDKQLPHNGEDKSYSSLTDTHKLEVKPLSDCTSQEDYKNCGMRCPELTFYPSEGTINAKGCMNVAVTFSPMMCSRSKWAIACEVAGGKSLSQYAIAHTLAAAPEVNLLPCNMDLGITYVGLSITKTVFLQNPSPLPCKFCWTEDAFRGFSFVTIEVEPIKGVLSPHCNQEIFFKLTPKEPGEKNFVVECQAPGMMHPLKLGFRLYVSDVSCRFQLEQPLKLNHTVCSKIEYSKAKLSDLKSIDRSKLPDLNFGKRCRLGVVQSSRVIVQNETAVTGKVWASVAKFGLLLSEEQISKLTGRYTEGNPKRTMILNDCRKRMNQQFWSKSGCSMSLKRQWASACIKGRDQGLAIVLSASEGTLQAWESWHCEVFCYACMPGTYNDILHIQVGDNVKYEIPISIGVIGTPLLMQESCFEPQDLGRTGEKNCMALKWGAAPAGCPPRSKTFWVSNSAPFNLELDWEFYEPLVPAAERTIKVEINVEKEEQKVHVLMFGDPDQGPVQLRFEVEDIILTHVELLESVQKSMVESLFKIHPAKQCIASHSSVSFTVTFYSEDAGTFVSNLRGNAFFKGSENHMCIDNQSTFSSKSLEMSSNIKNKIQDVERTYFFPLHISLRAVSFPPRLMTNVEEILEASYVGSDPTLLDSSRLLIPLSHNYNYNLCFSVAASPPFYVKNVADNNPLSGCQNLSDFVLPPANTLQLRIDFLPSEENLTKHEDRVFDSNVLIKLFNKFEQIIPMIGKLIFPKIDTFTQSIWFGAVLMDSKQTLPFTIRNTSNIDAHWTLVHKQEETEPSTLVGDFINETTTTTQIAAFAFDICGGVLKASSAHTSNQQLVNVTFSPRALKFYRQTVCVEVFRGCGVSILLEGQGVSEMPQESPTPPPLQNSPKRHLQSQTKKPSSK